MIFSFIILNPSHPLELSSGYNHITYWKIDLKVFFVFSTKHKICRTTVDYIVKWHQETGLQKTKSKPGRRKATKAKENFINLQLAWQKVPNITAQLNQRH